MAADALLLGRVTYEGFAKAWPSMGGDPFGDKMNSVRKYVVSTTLTDEEATWNDTVVVRGDLATAVADLRAQPGGDILVEGSARCAQALIEKGLVDELRLMVFPIVLGHGKSACSRTWPARSRSPSRAPRPSPRACCCSPTRRRRTTSLVGCRRARRGPVRRPKAPSAGR